MVAIVCWGGWHGMRPTDEGSVTMRMFGSLVKTLRESQGLTRENLAEQVGYSKSLVAMIERGVRMPSQAFIDRGEEILLARGVLREAAPYLSRERYPSWFGEYVDVEATAVSLYTYNTHVLHGLVQTEEYARAVLGARCPILEDEEIARRVQARLDRQDLLTRVPAVGLAPFFAGDSFRSLASGVGWVPGPGGRGGGAGLLG